MATCRIQEIKKKARRSIESFESEQIEDSATKVKHLHSKYTQICLFRTLGGRENARITKGRITEIRIIEVSCSEIFKRTWKCCSN